MTTSLNVFARVSSRSLGEAGIFHKAISSYKRKENVNKKESVPGVQNMMVKSC